MSFVVPMFINIHSINIWAGSEINALRREIKQMKQQQKEQELKSPTKKVRSADTQKPNTADSMGRMISMQKEEIQRLRKRIVELEGEFHIFCCCCVC